jgi:hypothetical protein
MIFAPAPVLLGVDMAPGMLCYDVLFASGSVSGRQED